MTSIGRLAQAPGNGPGAADDHQHHLRALTTRARELIQPTANTAGAGHVGGSLSAADLLTTLYFDELRIDPARLDDPDRNRFVLSKGHCGLGLYVLRAITGYFDESALATFHQGGSRLQMHPDMTKLRGDRHLHRLARHGPLGGHRDGA